MNGVCGQSIMDNNTLIVADVSKFKNHIYATKIVSLKLQYPLLKINKKYVLDIDSKNLGGFDQIDEKYLKEIIEKI